MPSKNPSSPPHDSAAFPLELTCFGPPWARLRDRPSPPELHWRKHLAFLVYLALSPNRTRSRQHLLGVLWPDKDEQQARRSLNEAVRRLRCCLGGGRIVSALCAAWADGSGPGRATRSNHPYGSSADRSGPVESLQAASTVTAAMMTKRRTGTELPHGNAFNSNGFNWEPYLTVYGARARQL
jgi:hypothetical protein